MYISFHLYTLLPRTLHQSMQCESLHSTPQGRRSFVRPNIRKQVKGYSVYQLRNTSTGRKQSSVKKYVSDARDSVRAEL